MLTFAQLRDALTKPPFSCDCTCVIKENEVIDPTDPEVTVPAVYAFTRWHQGHHRIATVPVYHPHLALTHPIVLSVLARLAVKPEELGL